MRNVLVQIKSGSHLYGTNTENSDTDLLGVFIPSAKDMVLGKPPTCIKHQTNNSGEKNSKDDTDTTWYTVQEFFKHVARR